MWKPHWGERLVGKHRPVVVVLDTEADTITPLTSVPDDLSPGQPQWTPNGEGIVGVAWRHEPRYLGLISCTNRDSWIFYIKNDEFGNWIDSVSPSYVRFYNTIRFEQSRSRVTVARYELRVSVPMETPSFGLRGKQTDLITTLIDSCESSGQELRRLMEGFPNLY